MIAENKEIIDSLHGLPDRTPDGLPYTKACRHPPSG